MTKTPNSIAETLRAPMVLMLLLLAACSGGSSGPINPNAANGVENLVENGAADGIAMPEDDPMPPQATAATTATIMPAANDQPNTASPDTVIDSSGSHHATYSDIDGRVMYGYCTNDCGSLDS